MYIVSFQLQRSPHFSIYYRPVVLSNLSKHYHGFNAITDLLAHACPVRLSTAITFPKDQHDVHTIQTTVLSALPVYLREETSKFFKTCSIEDDSEEPDVDTSVALLTVVRELRGIALQYNPEKISMILENGVVITILQRFSDAFI
ncbi:hypothetical protein Q8A67_018619 [Cirrhinus molitorella]|uniref:Uncharacterized protein n=1 Tax=Cirrhinus molitorella TaxID=172907 RepID=A0AA88TEX6_9TELE|nr:hypothetical protein Q8A67_018619 [Cirrhinus molitorella]